MKALVVYDSQFGNTAEIAQAIGKGLANGDNIPVIPVGDITDDHLQDIELLVVGSPTQRLTATPAITDWLTSLPASSLQGIKAGAFDTRFTEEKIKELSKVLTFFVNMFGYGADPIAKLLKKKGAELVLEPEGFFVGDTEGPLLENELTRAGAWAKKLLS
jgi:flavodoxin